MRSHHRQLPQSSNPRCRPPHPPRPPLRPANRPPSMPPAPRTHVPPSNGSSWQMRPSLDSTLLSSFCTVNVLVGLNTKTAEILSSSFSVSHIHLLLQLDGFDQCKCEPFTESGGTWHHACPGSVAFFSAF